jgi:hypothetical protein
MQKFGEIIENVFLRQPLCQNSLYLHKIIMIYDSVDLRV